MTLLRSTAYMMDVALGEHPRRCEHPVEARCASFVGCSRCGRCKFCSETETDHDVPGL